MAWAPILVRVARLCGFMVREVAGLREGVLGVALVWDMRRVLTEGVVVKREGFAHVVHESKFVEQAVGVVELRKACLGERSPACHLVRDLVVGGRVGGVGGVG